MFRNYHQARWYTFHLTNLHGVNTVHYPGYVIIYKTRETLPICLVPLAKMTAYQTLPTCLIPLAKMTAHQTLPTCLVHLAKMTAHQTLLTSLLPLAKMTAHRTLPTCLVPLAKMTTHQTLLTCLVPLAKMTADQTQLGDTWNSTIICTIALPKSQNQVKGRQQHSLLHFVSC